MRLIDADHFLKTLEKTAENHEQKDAARKIAGAMTFMVEAEAAFFGIGWIPCEKKMPEEPFACIVTVHWEDPYSGEYDQLYHETVGWDGEGWNNSDGWTLPYEVTAWMKLPEAYHE